MAAALKIKVKVDVSRFKAAFAKLNGEEKKKIMDKVVRTDAMGFVRDVVAITPPGHQKAPLKSGNAGGIMAGKVKIRTDLHEIFNPMNDGILAKARKVGLNVKLFTISGTPYVTPNENFRPTMSESEMGAIHRGAFVRGRMKKGPKETMLGKVKVINRLVVSKTIFDSYLEKAWKKIGILAGGWAGAAKKLNVRLPKEVNRHASGDCQIITQAHSFIAKIMQPVSYATQADIARRVAWVLDSNKRANRMQTRIKVEIEAAAKRLGISL
jgi:hypothetical protein